MVTGVLIRIILNYKFLAFNYIIILAIKVVPLVMETKVTNVLLAILIMFCRLHLGHQELALVHQDTILFNMEVNLIALLMIQIIIYYNVKYFNIKNQNFSIAFYVFLHVLLVLDQIKINAYHAQLIFHFFKCNQMGIDYALLIAIQINTMVP